MRCFFNLVNSTERIVDHQGIEVRNIEQAWVQALRAIDELREEDETDPDDWARWSLEVTDRSGALLFAIRLVGQVH